MTDIKLYPHNQGTYNKIQEMWRTTNRVACIQATGTGKSFLILKCLFNIPDENKVVLAPTEYIFEQLKENVDEEIPNTQFLTYSKLSFMTEDEIQLINPTLIVLDEFHRCGAEEWGRGVQTLLNTFPDVKVLGTSATPIRYLDGERDMADELFNGNIAVNLPLAEAIVKGILPMPKYISALYTFEDEVENLKNKVINSHNSDEEKEELFEQINLMRNKLNRSKGIPKIFGKHLTQPNGKFIVFCKNKEHLHEMKSTVINWFKKAKISNKIETYTVYTGYKNTDQEFEAFKNNDNNDSLKLLFSIEMLNEGLHINDITGVILLRPTCSPIIYYQQIGRAIDAGSSDQPLIFDFVNNFDNLGATQFIDDLNKYRQKEIRNRRKNSNSDNIDIPEFVIWDEVKEVKNLFSNIENQLMDNWDIMYEKLKIFYKENGHSNVSTSIRIKKSLEMWVACQRQIYAKGLLSQDKIEKLQKLDFTFCFDYDSVWNEMYKKLKLYYENNGNIDISYNAKKIEDKFSITDENIILGRFIDHQRKNFKKGNMNLDKVKKLEELKIKWNVIKDSWDEQFNELKQFYNNNNNNNIPYDSKLYIWAASQRNKYRSNKLTPEQINKLNEINFVWEILDNKWVGMYNGLIKYNNEYGNYIIPKDYMIDNKSLRNWASIQRHYYFNNNLSEEKIELLNSINFIWNPLDYLWNNMFNILLEYKKEYGDCDVYTNLIYKDEKLGSWVTHQRSSYSNNILPQDKIDKLNNIEFKWKAKRKIINRETVNKNSSTGIRNVTYISDRKIYRVLFQKDGIKYKWDFSENKFEEAVKFAEQKRNELFGI